MQFKRIALFIAAAAAAVLLPLVLLLTDVQLTAFDRGYYEKEYVRYNIAQNIGIGMDELMSSTDKLLQYMDGKRPNLDFKAQVKGQQVEFFSDMDKIHMVDVLNLFKKGKVIRNSAAVVLVLFIAYLLSRGRKGIPWMSGAGIAAFVLGVLPVIVLIILMNVDFYKYFTVFHEIFFTNNYWLMDPAKDRLVNLFPQEFFSDMAFRIAYMYLAELAGVLLISVLGRRRLKKMD